MPIFHYAVAGAYMSQNTTTTPPKDDKTSGLAVAYGFMVTLGGWTPDGLGTKDEQAGTFMHELGHVIGLDHSGGQGDADAVNFKPNYPSVMNYAHQSRGVFRAGVRVLDYSRADMPDVDETTLTEAGGVSLGANPLGYGTAHSCSVKAADGTVTRIFTGVQATLAPVDWNCDGTTPNGGTGFDANGDLTQNILKGTSADWNRLVFLTGGVGRGKGAEDTVTIPGVELTEPKTELTFEMARTIRVLPMGTTLTYTGATTADYHDRATVSATLVDSDTGAGVAGRSLGFTIGTSPTDTCTAQTGSDGSASCDIRVTQQPGSSTVGVAYAGDGLYAASNATGSFAITREETTTVLTVPNAVLAGSGATTVTARLVEDGAGDNDGDGGSAPPDPYGQTITFTLGTQTCTGTTDATGAASCSIPSVSGAELGPRTLTAAFAGDTHYEPSSDRADVIVFAFPKTGAFALGSAVPTSVGSPVTWWSSSWRGQNPLTTGSAADAFKGYAKSVDALPTTSPATSCGLTFSTAPGASAPAPSDIPSYMGVVVADSVATPSGGSITGSWGRIVVVKTAPGYAPTPGFTGTGTVVASFCP